MVNVSDMTDALTLEAWTKTEGCLCDVHADSGTSQIVARNASKTDTNVFE